MYAGEGRAPANSDWSASFALYAVRIPVPEQGLHVAVTSLEEGGSGRLALALTFSAASPTAVQVTLVLGELRS